MKKSINSLFSLRTIRLLASSILVATVLLVLPVAIYAQQVENTRVISYQGSITTNSGSQVIGEHQITTTLYSDANGTQAVWSGTYKQQITGGLFTVLLGSGAYPLPSAQDFSKTLWVGVRIDGGAELKPLTQLTGAPYSVSIADKSVTKDKIAVDYVGSIMVNGKRITGKGTTLNLVDGVNTSLLYDERTNSLSLNSFGGISAPTPQNVSGPWNNTGDPLTVGGITNQTFGSTDAADVIMIAKNSEQMRMMGQQGGGTLGLSIPTTANTGQGIIFQNITHTYIHSFGGVTNFFAGNDAGNLTMSGTGVQSINNTGVGDSTLFKNTTGYENTACGAAALNANTTGYHNASVGYWALWKNTTGYNNTACGACALLRNTTGYQNTATGWGALNLNTTGYYNIAYGSDALHDNTTGYQNSSFGVSALEKNTTGYYNTASGYRALYSNTTGGSNTTNGYESLYSNTDGIDNVANGNLALYSNVHGVQNTSIGSNTLYWNTGSDNTATGYTALFWNTTSSHNTATGYQALIATTGGFNTALGSSAGITNATGTDNTFVGYSADASVNSLTNATAIGANATVSQSNAVILGNAADVGIRTSTPRAELDVNSTGAIIVPVGTTAQRPTPVQGMIRYNTTTSKFEGYDGAAWQNLN